MVEAATAKLFTSEVYEKLISDAIQVMGGDGWTRFYPVESYLRDAKVNQIGAGTNEIMKLVIFRGGLKTLGKDLKMPRREKHEKLGIPTSTTKPLPKLETSENNVLKALAQDYHVNPGLFMSRDDLKERLKNPNDQTVDKLLVALEEKGMVRLYRDSRGTIGLAKATYKGLREAEPLENYKWYPDWLSKEFVF
jgi:hypothetical protein